MTKATNHNSQNHLVIATAGHVDHGKTTLIKALTGIETDTLKDEKERGLSINLGFAYLDLPNGDSLGLVDVPGHERFIKNMIAGLSGIDLVMLIVDVNEGFMPQTKEHLDIIQLLGIENLIVVLTKVDQADPEMVSLVREVVREELQATNYPKAPIFAVDSLTREGLDELVQELTEFSETYQRELPPQQARLNIDRVFSVKGFGTVVTGTLLGHSLEVDDSVYLSTPEGVLESRIRQIQVHKDTVERAYPGQRTAINLVNVTQDQLDRGDVLTKESPIEETWMLDASIDSLPSDQEGIQLWDRVRVLIGAREVMARIVPLGVDVIDSHELGFAQLRLEEPIAVSVGDVFVLRTYSPITTIAGGKVLATNPEKHRRFDEQLLERLLAMESGALDALLLDYLRSSQQFISHESLQQEFKLEAADLDSQLETLEQQEQVLVTDYGVIATETYTECLDHVRDYLTNYHQQYPLRLSCPVEEVRSQIKQVNATIDANAVLQLMLDRQELQSVHSHDAKEGIALTDHQIQLTLQQKQAIQAIQQELDEAKFMPVKVTALAHYESQIEDLLQYMNDEVIFLTHEYVISRDYYQAAIQAVKDFLTEHEQMTLADFRDLTESSRKSSMLILEQIDEDQITQRVENYRILHPKSH